MIVDEAILEGCMAGKREAQCELYKAYASTMMAMCCRYAGSRHEAEDILQEGFMKVFEKIRSFRGDGSFEGWMKRIMINTALNQIRIKRRTPFHEDIDLINETRIQDDGEPAGNLDPVPADVLMEMIGSLPSGYRIVFSLYVLEDFTHKEIAAELKISENTSKTQLMKAKKLLKSKVDKYYSIHNPKVINE